MRTLLLVVAGLGIAGGCQSGERPVGAIAPRPASERAQKTATDTAIDSATALPRPSYDPWAWHEPAVVEIPWADTFSTAAQQRNRGSAYDWQPGTTISFELGAQEPVAAANSGPVVSAMTSNQSLIAVTEDATAAVTVDIVGSARLWPTLDGTREPVVIRLQAPEQIAVARDGDELAIAAIDHAGQLEISRLATTGEPRGHRWVESQRPFTALWFAGQTLLAMRDDHAIAGFDARGTPLGVLVSDPGEHIATVAVRSGRALAILDAEGVVRGRWLGLGGSISWGERTVPLPVLARDVALAPDGARIAGVNATHRAVLIVELATGKIARRALRRDDPDPALRPAGFLTNRVLAMGTSFAVLEWSGRDMPDTPFRSSAGPIAIADGLAVGDDLGSLALVGTSGPGHFLGYRTGTLSDLQPIGAHFLATDTASVIEVDEKFHTFKAIDLPVDENGRGWYGITLLDKTHVVANHYASSTNALFVVDLPSTKATLIAERASLFGYEAKTHLLEYVVDDRLMVARFESKTGTLGAPASLLLDRGSTRRLQLLDPDVSRGNVAALIDFEDSSTLVRITLIKSVDPARADQFERGASREFRVDDEFWQTHNEADLIARMLPLQRQHSPDKQLTAELHDQRITLRDRDGNERWTVASRGANTLLWTPDGALVAYGSGVARLDLATGAMVDRQCGWRFGRWDESPQAVGSADQCEAP